jgi:hypothetical protein
MERSRRAGWRRMHNSELPGPALALALSRSAVARFWELLADFCAVRAAPPAWQPHLGPAHPFFGFDRCSATWRVQRPPT